MRSSVKLAFAAAAVLGAGFLTLQPASAMPIAPVTQTAESAPLVQNVWYRHYGYYHRPYYRHYGYYHRPYYRRWGYYHRPYYRHWRHW
jgi:hypothetical protein